MGDRRASPPSMSRLSKSRRVTFDNAGVHDQVVRDQSTDDFFNKMADQGPLAFQAINNQILFNDNLVKRRHEAKMQPLMGRPGCGKTTMYEVLARGNSSGADIRVSPKASASRSRLDEADVGASPPGSFVTARSGATSVTRSGSMSTVVPDADMDDDDSGTMPEASAGATSQLGGGVKGLKDLNLGVFLETQTAEHAELLRNQYQLPQPNFAGSLKGAACSSAPVGAKKVLVQRRTAVSGNPGLACVQERQQPQHEKYKVHTNVLFDDLPAKVLSGAKRPRDDSAHQG